MYIVLLSCSDSVGSMEIAPTKTYERNFIRHVFYNSENSIREITSFCRTLFFYNSVVKYTSSFL